MAYDDFQSAYNGGYFNPQMGGMGGNGPGFGSYFNNGSGPGYGMGGLPNQTQNQMPQQQQQGGHTLSSLMTAIPSVLQGFGAIGNNSGNNTLNTLGNNQANLSNAMTNTSNPLYQQMYGQEKAQNMSNLTGALNMMQGQNRMQSAMGRTPLFAVGRGGEQNFRQLMQGYQNQDLTAQNQTRAALAQAMQGNSQSAMLGNQQHAANAGQNNSMLNSFNSIGQLMKSFGGM